MTADRRAKLRELATNYGVEPGCKEDNEVGSALYEALDYIELLEGRIAIYQKQMLYDAGCR